jgi:ADP-ribosylglycohydrolase
MAAAANVAYTKLLLKLMASPAAPAPGSYLDYVYHKLKLVETSREYSSRMPRFDGWQGTLSEFLASAIPSARRRSLSFVEAVSEWGSSAYLLEMMPTLLYLLECYGHQPKVALELATQGPHASPLLAALAGATLGALHGVIPGYEPQGELQEILERLPP